MPWKPIDGDEYPTLGYQVADWITNYLLSPDDPDKHSLILTLEQLDFVIRLYEIDPKTSKRVKHRAVISRSRGWGKSPFLAAIAAAETMGPVRCAGWDADGQPVGVPVVEYRKPEVVVAATTIDQTDNTFDALIDILNGSPAEFEYGLEFTQDMVTMPRGTIRRITSSSTSAKGRRSTAAILDQTEAWLPSNGGPKLAQVLRNNATKLDGVTIESPNAYTIGENSVAEKSAEFARLIAEGKIKDSADVHAATSFLYDHRSAPLDTDIGDMDSLIYGLRVAYGDSSGHPDGCLLHDPPCQPGWVNIHRVAADFWDTANDPEIMRADFLNIIGAATDAYVTAPELRAIENTEIVVSADEPVTLGFDGSEGRNKGIADSTVLIGYALKSKHIFKVGVWEQPDGPQWQGWTPPRLEIEETVRDFFAHHNVVGFYADPSAGWAGDVKNWEAQYHQRLKTFAKSKSEPITWPQRNVTNTCEAFAQLLSAIRQKQVTYDGSPELTRHFLNARRDPRRAGYVLKKADDNQDYGKIDATWGAMMAYKAGIDAVGAGVLTQRARRRAPRRLY